MHRLFYTPPRIPSFDTNSEYSSSDGESEDEHDVPLRVHPVRANAEWSWQRVTTNAVLMYVAVIIVHFAGANLYSRLCTSQTLHGLFMSPFLVPAPHCEGLRWIVYHGAARINGMWLLIGSQIVEMVARMFVFKKM